MNSFFTLSVRKKLAGIEKDNISTKVANKLSNSIDKLLTPLISADRIESNAKSSQFVQRKGKITGVNFLHTMLFYSNELDEETLSDICMILDTKFNVHIEEQSLNERFNCAATEFLRLVIKDVLKETFKDITMVDISGFNRVLIKDSTSFQIDESHRESYKGSGGSGSPASMRIQFEYDILSSNIVDFSVHEFVDQDATNSLITIELLEKGDLVIRDLAYMGTEVLQEIVTIGAHFLCRLGSTVSVYEKDFNGAFVRLLFSTILKRMKKNNQEILKQNIYIKKGVYFEVCLVLYLLPNKIVEKRKRDANNKTERRKKKKRIKKLPVKPLSEKGRKARLRQKKENDARLHFNIMITNIENPCVETMNLYELYTVRWQIELIFKCWKSVLKINNVKKVKLERLECYVLSKMLLVLLTWRITWSFTNTLYDISRVIVSYIKSVKFLKINRKDILDYTTGDSEKKTSYIKCIYRNIKRHCLLDVKKGRISSWSIIENNIF